MWATGASTFGASFAACLVEAVEALTIILAVWYARGWKPAIAGATAAFLLLAFLVATFGSLLAQVPLQLLQIIIGIFLLLFGMGWLRKAILRASGHLALHDEDAIFEKEKGRIKAQGTDHKARNWIAGMIAFKAVLIEGIEVVFIVVAVGAQRHASFMQAVTGALLACLLVILAGVFIHKPLSRVPENTLKFGVAILLVSFGLFWTCEGLGIHWPGGDTAILFFAAIMILVSLSLVRAFKKKKTP